MNPKNQAASALESLLEASGIACKATQDSVLFERWPTLAFRILEVEVDQTSASAVIVHMHVRAELNMQRPDSFITTCGTGVGAEVEAAIRDGVNTWLKTEGSVLFSLLNQGPVMEAEWCPEGDLSGVPGWNCFLSPYFIRGQQPNQEILSAFVQEQPLLEPIRHQLGTYLDRQSLFHSVSIFRGMASGEPFADCHIDGVAIPLLGQTLRSAPWPAEVSSFGTVRQSLLLLNPGGAG